MPLSYFFLKRFKSQLNNLVNIKIKKCIPEKVRPIDSEYYNNKEEIMND